MSKGYGEWLNGYWKQNEKIKCEKKKKNTHISSWCHKYGPIFMCIKNYARNLYICVVDHD
jgi:hypothetical protein